MSVYEEAASPAASRRGGRRWAYCPPDAYAVHVDVHTWRILIAEFFPDWMQHAYDMTTAGESGWLVEWHTGTMPKLDALRPAWQKFQKAQAAALYLSLRANGRDGTGIAMSQLALGSALVSRHASASSRESTGESAFKLLECYGWLTYTGKRKSKRWNVSTYRLSVPRLLPVLVREDWGFTGLPNDIDQAVRQVAEAVAGCEARSARGQEVSAAYVGTA